jgi:predicted nucleic acid-binding protein
MKRYVADASTVATFLFQEPLVEQARCLLFSGQATLAPDLIYAELANVIWKRNARGMIGELEAMALLKDVWEIPLEITSCNPLAGVALKLAMGTKRSAYDCIYLALASTSDATMVTTDMRLINALTNTPWAEHVAWLGDVS